MFIELIHPITCVQEKKGNGREGDKTLENRKERKKAGKENKLGRMCVSVCLKLCERNAGEEKDSSTKKHKEIIKETIFPLSPPSRCLEEF